MRRVLPAHPLLPRTVIGNDTTALLPSIQFDPAMLPPPGSTLPCSLELPPEHLREVHWPALLEECVARMRAAVADPVKVERDGPLRRVGVLGSCIWERQTNGRYHVYEWIPGEVVAAAGQGHMLGLPELVRIEDCEIGIDGCPQASQWLAEYARGLRYALYLQWPDHPLIEPYLDWAVMRLEQRFWTVDIQRRVRGRLASALKLEPRVLARARRWLACEDGSPMCLSHYHLALWRRQQWPRLKAESPQWLPMLAQLWRRLPTEGDPVENLRALLLVNGVSPAMWRLLHREGTSWIWGLRNYYTKGSQHDGRAVIELVLKAQLFGTRALVPVWMLREMLNLDGNPNRPRRSYLRETPDPVDKVMAARLGHWARELQLSGDVGGLEQLQRRCHLLLSWSLHHEDYATSRAMRQISLQGLVQKAEAWEQLRIARANTENAWRARFDLGSVSHDGLEAVLLCSSGEILEEAQAMRHCADGYVARCRRGAYFMLSVRRRDSSVRVATVGVVWGDDGLVLHQMAGFANALVPPEIEAFARQAVASMRQQVDVELSRPGYGRRLGRHAGQPRVSRRSYQAEGDAIRRAVVAASRHEQQLGEFRLYGRGHEPRVQLCRSLAATLRGQPIPRVRICGHFPNMYYAERVFERAVELLCSELGYSPIELYGGVAMRVQGARPRVAMPAGTSDTTSQVMAKECS